MRITVSMPSTGLVYAPGLARPVVLDVDGMPKDIADKLKALAKRADVFDHGDTAEKPSSQMRDGQQFVIHVEDGEKQQTLRVAEPFAGGSAMKEFVQLVRDQANLARSAAAPASTK
jgi:hypothetical protein